jgi:hypothetical protein
MWDIATAMQSDIIRPAKSEQLWLRETGKIRITQEDTMQVIPTVLLPALNLDKGFFNGRLLLHAVHSPASQA